MSSNSAIFTTTVFGRSSGLTAAEQTAVDTETKETFLVDTSTNNLRTAIPRVPSNQKYMKD